MKIVKCGKYDEYNYCIVQQTMKYTNKAKTQQYRHDTFELFLDVTTNKIVQKWLALHANDEDIQCLSISKGIVSVASNGKAKIKFRDHTFARFRLRTCDHSEVMELASSIFKRVYEFKIKAAIECIRVDEHEELPWKL